MATRVHLVVILYVGEVLRNLGLFAFVALHLFYESGKQLSAIVELLHLTERLEELHIKVQGTISSPNLATTLLSDV